MLEDFVVRFVEEFDGRINHRGRVKDDAVWLEVSKLMRRRSCTSRVQRFDDILADLSLGLPRRFVFEE